MFFCKGENAMNNVFKAISDPTRRKILDLLKGGDMTAGDIAEHFNISKPSISHHLNILKQAEVISDHRKGQFIYYSLNTTVLQDSINWMLNFINKGDNDL
ncbi:transcriptional regulator of SdpC synthesis operon (ArsR family) [Bacillus subtilis]|nr:Transcriptional regulator (ArsR family) [Bacillus subtilis QB928]